MHLPLLHPRHAPQDGAHHFVANRIQVLGNVFGGNGVFTLFAILFVFVGLQLLALGLLGEYVGRIYREVRRRPRYVIKRRLD